MSSTLRSAHEDAGLKKGRGEGPIVLAARAACGWIGEPGNVAEIAAGHLSRFSQVRSDSASAGSNPAIQDSRMMFGFFVESKFIPEHVQHKTLAGQIHYQAILKHLLRPETVNRIFNPRNVAKARLRSVSDWPYLDDVRLCDITVEHVRRIVASSRSCEYSPQTVKHIKNVFFAIISHAQRERCFSGPNPVAQVKLLPIARKEQHHLTISQTKAMLELMQYPEREIALMTITTGMNILEIGNLQWKHVNLSDASRDVDGDVVQPKSIALRPQWNRIGLGDSKRGRKKDIEIPQLLIAVLEDLKKRGMPSTDDFVLTSNSGQPILSARVSSARLKVVGRKLGLPWLSWRVIGRAHTALLSEFRTELNDHMMVVVHQQLPNPVTVASNETGSAASKEWDTIGRKFPCGSFRAGRQCRQAFH
jgi:integrase